MRAPAVAVGAFWLAFTLALYAAARWGYARTRVALLSPGIVAIVGTIVVLQLTGTPYADYERGGRVLSFLLGPAIVALGVPLAREIETVKRDATTIALAMLVAAVVGVVSATGTALLLGASPAVARSLAPRSVTTPIAIAVSEHLGGVPAISAAVVIATGLLGGVIGPSVLRLIGMRHRAGVGIALGAAAHGLGTARAAEEGDVEGAMSGLAMGLMGIATALLAPPIIALLAWLARGRL